MRTPSASQTDQQASNQHGGTATDDDRRRGDCCDSDRRLRPHPDDGGEHRHRDLAVAERMPPPIAPNLVRSGHRGHADRPPTRATRDRARIGRRSAESGPFVALVPPAVLGCVSLLLLRGHTSLARGVGGFVAAVLAAPGLLVAGVPLRSGRGVYLAAVVGSAVLWMIVGCDRGTAGNAASGCIVARLLARVRVAGARSVAGRRGRPGRREPDLRSRPVLIGVVGAHTVTRPRRASSLAGPMPRTSPSCSTLWNGPCWSRWATIAAAVVGPTPGGHRVGQPSPS